MQIDVNVEGNEVTIIPRDIIDFTSAPELEKVIEEEASKSQRMVIDMGEVPYISSAGLRAILLADNLMDDKSGFALKNVNSSVKELLNISGFTDELDIE